MRPAANGVVVRPVEAQDVPAVIALVTRVLAEFDLVFGDGSASDLELAALPGVYRDVGGAFWVAEDASGLLGTCGLFPVPPSDARLFELRKTYLDARARGLGLGTRLLAEAVAFARATSSRAIVLDTVDQMQAAIRFYERHGFVRDDAQIRGARCTRGYVLML